MPEPDWREAHQKGIAVQKERWQKIAQDTGAHVSDDKLRKHVEKTQREASERAIREHKR